jgi:hypothetical protein
MTDTEGMVPVKVGLRHVDIELVGVGTRGTSIVIDGQDVTHAISELHIDAQIGKLTTMTVGFPLIDKTAIRGPANVQILDSTRDALIGLGWTPPDGVSDTVE